MRSSGDVDFDYGIDILNSYGRIQSPDTSYDYISDNRNFSIQWDGNIDGLIDPDYSYGSPDTYWDDEIAYFIGPSGSLGGFSNGVWDSYGYKTPYTGYVDSVYGVVPIGVVSYYGGYDSSVSDSYGRIISPDIELFNMQYAWHVSQYGDTNIIDAVYDLSSYGINKI